MNNGTRQSSPYVARINGAVSAGATQIVVDNKSGSDLIIGDFVRISSTITDSADASSTSVEPYEVRRVEHATALDGDATLFLDRPLGFAHGDNGYVVEVSGVERTTAQVKLITEVPGVYESITVPDLTPSYEPRYF